MDVRESSMMGRRSKGKESSGDGGGGVGNEKAGARSVRMGGLFGLG